MLKSVLNQALREIMVPDIKLVQTTRDNLVVCEYIEKQTLPRVDTPQINQLIDLYNQLFKCIKEHCIKLKFNNVYFKVGDNYYCFYDDLIILNEAQSNELTRENIFDFLNKKRKFTFFSRFRIDCSPNECEEKKDEEDEENEEMQETALQVKQIDEYNPERDIQVQSIEAQIDKMNILMKVLEKCIKHKVYIYYCKKELEIDAELLAQMNSGVVPETCLNLVIDVNVDVNETVSQYQKLLLWEQRNPRNATDPDMTSDRDRSTALKGPKMGPPSDAESQRINLHMIKLRIYRQSVFQQNQLLSSSRHAEIYKSMIEALIDEIESSAERHRDNLERELVEHIRMLNTLEQNIRNMGAQRAIRKMLFAFAVETNNDELKRIVRVDPLIGVGDMLGVDRQSKFFKTVLTPEFQFVILDHSLHEGIQNEMVARHLATVAPSASPKPSPKPSASPKPPPKPAAPPKPPPKPAAPPAPPAPASPTALPAPASPTAVAPPAEAPTTPPLPTAPPAELGSDQVKKIKRKSETESKATAEAKFVNIVKQAQALRAREKKSQQKETAAQPLGYNSEMLSPLDMIPDAPPGAPTTFKPPKAAREIEEPEESEHPHQNAKLKAEDKKKLPQEVSKNALKKRVSSKESQKKKITRSRLMQSIRSQKTQEKNREVRIPTMEEGMQTAKARAELQPLSRYNQAVIAQPDQSRNEKTIYSNHKKAALNLHKKRIFESKRDEIRTPHYINGIVSEVPRLNRSLQEGRYAAGINSSRRRRDETLLRKRWPKIPIIPRKYPEE